MGKFKPFRAKKEFKPPTKKTSPEGTEDSTSDAEGNNKKNEHIEAFEVNYTKHLYQNLKTWEEGYFEYNTKNFKAALFTNKEKVDCIDSKYMRQKPLFQESETFKMNKFLVEIQAAVLDAEEQAIVNERRQWE